MTTTIAEIQVRRGSTAQWESANPILAAGEIGFEIDANQMKIGTGETAWVDLPYFEGPAGPAGPTGPAGQPPSEGTELFTLSPTDILAKFVLIAHAPAVPGNLKCAVLGLGSMIYGVHFTYVLQGGTQPSLSWDGLALADVLVSGDLLQANYTY